MIDASPWKVAGGLAFMLALLTIATWIAGAVFNLAVGIPVESATPVTFPLAWVYVRNEPSLHRALGFAWLAFGCAAALAAVVTTDLFRHRVSLHGTARFARYREIRRAGMMGAAGIIIGRLGRHYLHSPGNTHVILCAPTRTGKGVGVVIPNLLSWPQSTVTLDVKGENYEITAGHRAKHGIDCYFFNPVDEERRTHRYNPLAYIGDHPDQQINDIQKIAAFLFPNIDGQDPIWNASARSLFLGVVLFILETPGYPRTMGEVLRQVTKTEEAGRYFSRMIGERQASGNPLSAPCVSALSDFIGTSTNTRTSIRKTFSSRLELWFNPLVDAATAANDFDLRQLRRKPMSIYFGVTPDNLERLAPLTNLFFQQALDLNTRVLPEQDRSLKLQVLFILDEFANFGAMNLVMKGISYVGGYGLRLLTILQSPAQLSAVYGDDNARTYFTNNAVKIHFRPSDDRDADSLSKGLGTDTLKSSSRSRQLGMRGGGSVSTSDHARVLMLPQELRQMKDNVCIIQADNVAYPLKVRKIRYYAERAFSERLLPAPAILPHQQTPVVHAVPASEGLPASATATPAASGHLPERTGIDFGATLRSAIANADRTDDTAMVNLSKEAILTALMPFTVEDNASASSARPEVAWEIAGDAGTHQTNDIDLANDDGFAD